MNHEIPDASDTQTDQHPEIVARLQAARAQLKQEIGRVVIGQEKVIDSLLIAMLCRGVGMGANSRHEFDAGS